VLSVCMLIRLNSLAASVIISKYRSYVDVSMPIFVR
jgi:hypothetical protein